MRINSSRSNAKMFPRPIALVYELSDVLKRYANELPINHAITATITHVSTNAISNIATILIRNGILMVI